MEPIDALAIVAYLALAIAMSGTVVLNRGLRQLQRRVEQLEKTQRSQTIHGPGRTGQR